MPKLTAAQRHEIPQWSLSHVGWGNGTGYPGKANNPACKAVGHGLEFSCADGVTASAMKAGLPFKSMQPGMVEGYDSCFQAYHWGQQNKALIKSWNAKVGDPILVDTGSGAQPGHTEDIYKITGTGASRRLFTVGWDSGPSNIPNGGGTGQGGVHLHVWDDPVGKGNPSIMAALDADKCVDWAKVTGPTKNVKKKRLKPVPIVKDSHAQVSLAGVPQPQRHWIRKLIELLRGK